MATTNENWDYYYDIFLTPCYLMRKKLEEDYEHIAEFGLNTLGMVALVAEHLTAYNELSMSQVFYRIRDFEVTI